MNRLLFLTSTVTPMITPFYGSIELRRQEYIKAIKFYLENTNHKILVVDNNGYDFNQDFPNESRLEALCYIESRSIAKGKGYGESLLMQYGFEHSEFIKVADQIVKITGRHIIKNVNGLLNYCSHPYALYVDSPLDVSYPRSFFFVSPKSFLEEYLFKNTDKMNDSAGVHIEHVLGYCIKDWLNQGLEYHEFRLPIHIVGRPGTQPTAYSKPSLKQHLLITIKYMLFEVQKLFKNKW